MDDIYTEPGPYPTRWAWADEEGPMDSMIGTNVPIQPTTGYHLVRGTTHDGDPIAGITFNTEHGPSPVYQIPIEEIPELIDALRRLHAGSGQN